MGRCCGPLWVLWPSPEGFAATRTSEWEEVSALAERMVGKFPEGTTTGKAGAALLEVLKAAQRKRLLDTSDEEVQADADVPAKKQHWCS